MERSQPKKSRAPRAKSAGQAAVALAASKQAGAVAAACEEPGDWSNRKATAQATRAANARQVSGRRRFVDPTTCERDYSAAEMEFMHAMQDYKVRSGRMFPTWSEVLEVIKALGYEKPEDFEGGAPGAPAGGQGAGPVAGF